MARWLIKAQKRVEVVDLTGQESALRAMNLAMKQLKYGARVPRERRESRRLWRGGEV